MPPKRKNKGTRALVPTPLKAPPAAAASSGSQAMQAKRRNSLQGGKSRLAPSTPLHMTTRRAAKTASNHTSSGAPSVASSSSRRSSLNDAAQFEDAHSEIEDERPAKRARLSTDSGSSRHSTGSFADQNTVNGTQTPELQKDASRPVSNGSKASSRKRRASDDSTQSSRTVSARTNGVLARTQSDISEQQPRRKKRRTTQTPAEAADQPPELTDASTAPNTPEPEHGNGVDSSQSLRHVLSTNGDAPAKQGRRLPGRRRAPHPDINVETDLRRQLNLKMNYRSLAKLQKNILEELSSRATKSLQNDPDYYKQCPEYEPLMAALDQHKDSRLSQLEALRTEKLDQLERVRVATERIEKLKYIQRFKDLQEDLLLQCFYRMKQVEREMKGAQGAATDDEDNVIAPTHTLDFPIVVADDRLGSKFASRSRAYVEAERVLDEDILRKRFDQQRKAFVANDEDADDSIEDISGGFAAFAGPERTEALAHWNIMSLVDAAADVESTPVQPQPPKIISNEHADALSLLASISADRAPLLLKQQDETMAPPAELLRAPSPVEPHPPTSAATASELNNVLHEAPYKQYMQKPITPLPETNGVHPPAEPRALKNETPARSTHRVMDMLNDDAEVPVSKMRDSRPPAREQTPAATPSRRVSMSHGTTTSRNSLPGVDSIVYRQEAQSDRSSIGVQAPSLPLASDAPPSSPSTSRYGSDWTPRMPGYLTGMSEESLRRRDPLNAIRAMLDAKALAEGRVPPSLRLDNPENIRKAAAERERAQMTAPPHSRPFSSSGTHGRQDTTSKDARRPSVGGYTSSPSAPPLSYNQSPITTSAHPPARHGSQDASSSQWGRDRSHSGSQAPQHYANSSPHAHQAEPSRSDTNPPPHQSPYSTTNAPQLPSISSSLPPKPPGPPPNINYRFAHYDPAPPRQAYPSPSTAGYLPASYPPQYGQSQPQPPHYGHSGPTSYNGPSAYHSGYVPPPGSFQAPPPPTSAITPYPPLKIHQYGGQPILPASMAPPPPHSQPQPPPPSYMSQPPSSATYSPTQQHSMPSRTPSYDQGLNAPRDPRDLRDPRDPRDPQGDRSSESQGRQRRQYRSYHAPGTQFRSYQGPDSGRRRGG
ncbi:hypothetical protein K458DRAFT_440215 [Lentithecium fluviatile CBS 122367]|uniref:Uncharacterized protein n=1 Tax=Lentithecium fluviatile CBS 122367 TaxID=1168545 RepID=A0A6G1JEH9_9PLEO|nr:hypothetical protein K458DRAFT_440215 [Lentithecium fluviatile CBS 122367]